MQKQTISPVAQRVIVKCGGVAKTAQFCGRTKSWVYKWTYPKDRNGRGGIVPHEDAEKLLAAAARGEVNLSPSDFFSPTPEATPKAAR